MKFLTNLQAKYEFNVPFWLLYFVARILIFAGLFELAGNFVSNPSTISLITGIVLFTLDLYFGVKTLIKFFTKGKSFFDHFTTK